MRRLCVYHRLEISHDHVTGQRMLMWSALRLESCTTLITKSDVRKEYHWYNYSFASSLTVPTFSFGAYFFNTLSLWYYSIVVSTRSLHAILATKEGEHTFQNCLLASLPPTLFKIFAPPGCSSTNVSILYTLPSIMM
jgi:hypothetical protein